MAYYRYFVEILDGNANPKTAKVFRPGLHHRKTKRECVEWAAGLDMLGIPVQVGYYDGDCKRVFHRFEWAGEDNDRDVEAL